MAAGPEQARLLSDLKIMIKAEGKSTILSKGAP